MGIGVLSGGSQKNLTTSSLQRERNFATFGDRVGFCMDFTCPCLCDVGLK